MPDKSNKQKVLLAGAGGMLGAEFVDVFRKEGYDLRLVDQRNAASDVSALDITSVKAVDSVVSEYSPDWIVNCAAYTQVDRAEVEADLAFQVNAWGVAILAKAARNAGAKMVHISTDYVFGGDAAAKTRTTPYREDEPTAPCGVYGQSKCLGDELLCSLLPKAHLIVRTSWLHGPRGKNFVTAILDASRQKKELRVVNDQFGSPTWAPWLAQVVELLMKRGATGLFHASSRGNISWFDFAKEICAQAGTNTTLLPQSTQELARPAPRPPYSTLDISKLEQYLDAECISWKEGVKAHLAVFGSA